MKPFLILLVVVLALGAWWEFRYKPTSQEKQYEQLRKEQDEKRLADRKAEIDRGWAQWWQRLIGGPNYYPAPASTPIPANNN